MISKNIIAALLTFAVAFPLFVTPLCSQTKHTLRPTNAEKEFVGLSLRPKYPSTKPRVGLVLSGGGARGLAQIGVLMVLEKYHIPVDLIVGNSLGSVIGGLYASGYTTSQIESIAINTNWAELLSFSEETKRSDLFVGQKQTQQDGYLVIRFDGLQPIIPSSISGGQRLLNFFSYLTLQALYHPNPSFDDLKISFRAISTDLVHGNRVVLDHGSLAEAMRASVTVPLLYSPLVKDSALLVDGGLTRNIPVDVAKSLGADFIVAVNSTSPMRTAEQMNAPWEIADQIMTIMMQEENKRQLQQADIVMTPEVGNRLVSDFSDIPVIIAAGEYEAERNIEKLISRFSSRSNVDSIFLNSELEQPDVSFTGDSLPASVRGQFLRLGQKNHVAVRDVQTLLDRISSTGEFLDLSAEVVESTIVLHAERKPMISSIQVLGEGKTFIPQAVFDRELQSLQGKIFSSDSLQRALENILSEYRNRGYSLARIESVTVDIPTESLGLSEGRRAGSSELSEDQRTGLPELSEDRQAGSPAPDSVGIRRAGVLNFIVHEGRIAKIKYEGNDRTKDYVIRREFPLEVGDVFDIGKASQGMVNIKSTGLFEYVLLDIQYQEDKPVLLLKVKEKSSELVRLGLHVDNEHEFVGTVDIHDANFRGAWEDLGLLMRYGYRDRIVQLDYTVNRIFHSYLTFNTKGYFKSRDVITYYDDPTLGPEQWDRLEYGRYRESIYGWSLSFGSHVERFGDIAAQLRVENQRISSLSGSGYAPDRYTFVGIKLRSTVDTEDKFSFPTSGMMLNLSYESATRQLGSDVGFGKAEIGYETYLTPWTRHTLRPRLTIGFADATLPSIEQFSLGGMNSFYGLREDDGRGRQIFLVNMEYRFRLPFKLIFETYLSARYDIGTISLLPEELTLSSFHHGVGAEIALDTPFGPARFALGKSFYFKQDLPNSPVSVGPLLFYFSVGHSL